MNAKRFVFVAATLLLSAGFARADSLPRLPQPLAFPQSGDSPGVVKFDHSSHVDAAKPSCTTCHPRLFSILGRSSERRPATITHARMEKGEVCGACHGKKTKDAPFGFDDCTMCHSK
jgi:c(7)-type cytochrome triheme protein